VNIILSKLIYYLVQFFHITYRYRYIGCENLSVARELGQSKGYLLGIWHQNLFHGILAQIGKPYVVIVSKSKDAEPVANLCSRMGNVVARGSSRSKDGRDKGGKQAKDEMIEVLKTGVPGAVTIDGPKGPAKEVKPGIIDMAKKSGTPLIPYVPIPERYWTFNSWDKFRLAKPFTKVIIYYGEPLLVSEDSDFETIKSEFKKSLDEIELKVRNHFLLWDTLSKENNTYH
jgi:lysophospholipid acyltransferase (LPLAT)-like uncharacterized protein